MPKRYYWLKLKDDFFRQLSIKKLRRIAGGDTYTIIYLKAMLLATKTDGIIDYSCDDQQFVEDLALELDEDPQNVAIAVEFMKTNSLMVPIEEGSVLLPEVKESTGSETAAAQRMRDMRNRKAIRSNNVTPMLQTSYVEKEIEIEKDKKKYIKKKSLYGEYKNVKLYPEEYEKLKAQFPDYQERIERLSGYIASKGDKYRSHYATIRNWAAKDAREIQAKKEDEIPF